MSTHTVVKATTSVKELHSVILLRMPLATVEVFRGIEKMYYESY